MKRVLFADTIHPELESILSSKGFECIHAWDMNLEELISATIEKDIEGIVIRSRFKLSRSIIEQLGPIKFIARFGSGMENIDIEAANKRNINCLNAPEGNSNAVAEMTIGLLLNILRNIQIADQQVRGGVWLREENRGYEVEGKTIAIIGFGRTGKSLYYKLKGFNCNLMVYDPYVKIDPDQFSSIQQTEMNEIYEHADIISFHIPLTDETNQMINETYLNKFKKPIWLLNTSRGKILNTAALADKIKAKQILGACLDVFEYESTSFEKLESGSIPDPLKFLLSSNKVILTPHIAGWTHESNLKLSQILAKKILDLYNT